MEFYVGDFVGDSPFGDVDGHLIADRVAQKGFAHRRIDGNRTVGVIGLIRPQQSELLFLAGVDILHMDGGSENDFVAVQCIQIDNVILRQLAFDISDARLQKALAFAGGVVSGIFLEVTFLAGFLDGLDNGGPFLFQPIKFLLKLLVALDGNGSAHDVFLDIVKYKKKDAQPLESLRGRCLGLREAGVDIS